MRIKLLTGDLQISTEKPEILHRLTGFGSRMSRKRGFVFAGKVLGKYAPARPAAMHKACQDLAALVKPRLLPGPCIVLGFAEVATALGWGVYTALGLQDSFYQHTTRHKLSRPVWLNFQEEHSHAGGHVLYQPAAAELRKLRDKAVNVVLVDDEFSTGRTLHNLVSQLRATLPKARRYIGAGLLNWMPAPLDGVETLQLHRGYFNFHAKNDTYPAALKTLSVTRRQEALDDVIPFNFGRLGIQGKIFEAQRHLPAADWQGKKVLVLGTGEFMYPAFMLARDLEKSGAQAYVQSTARNPLHVDRDICSRLRFTDNYHEDIDHFLYNVSHLPHGYDVILICYETPRLPEKHELKRQLQPYAGEVIELFMETC